MARSFDELLEFLDDQVAIRGESGTSVNEFRTLIEQFYRSNSADGDRRDAASSSRNESAEAVALVDDHLVGKVWSWLIRNPDIRVERRKQGIGGAGASVTIPAGSAQHSAEAGPSQSQPSSSTTSLLPTHDAVLVASKIIMWQALAGHPPDITRIKPMEFTLLSFIGAAGSTGIPQTELIHQSGQDKRSLPHRTDVLAERGYITKKPWRVKGCNTSLLTLKRFEQETEDIHDTFDPNTATSKEVYEYLFPPGRPCDLDRLVKVLVALLGTVNVMTAKQLRVRIGISANKLATRSFFVYLYRLELLGVLKRIGIPSVTGHTILLHSVQLLKRPDVATIQRFREFTGKDEEELMQARRSAGESLSDMIEPEAGQEPVVGSVEPEDDIEEVEAAVSISNSTRMLAQWMPNKPIANLFFDVIDAAGPEGLSTMDFNTQTLGVFYKRPMELTLGHLTDLWHKAQPPHLRHLAIVRDTRSENKTVHYQYRSYGNFVQAVANDDTSWEAIQWSPQKDKIKAKDAVDQWGFPVISPSNLHARTGAATVSEARSAHKFDRQSRSFLSDYLNMDPRASAAKSTRDIEATPTPQPQKVTGIKPLGRPRKYPKGREPYKSGNFYRDKDGRAFESKIMTQARQLAMAELPEADRHLLDPPKRKGRPPKANKELSKPRRRPLKQPLSGTSLLDDSSLAGPYETVVDFSQTAGDTSAGNESAVGTKRAATDDPEGEPSAKRQELDIEEYKRQLQARLNERIQALQQDMVTLSRSGLYISPPGSKYANMEASGLVVVAKSDRLRQLSWFTPSGAIPRLRRGAALRPSPALPSNEQAVGSIEAGNDTVDIETPKRATKRRKITRATTPVTVSRAVSRATSNIPLSTRSQSAIVETPPTSMEVDALLQPATKPDQSFLDQLVAWSNIDTPCTEIHARSNEAMPSGVERPGTQNAVDLTGSAVQEQSVKPEVSQQQASVVTSSFGATQTDTQTLHQKIVPPPNSRPHDHNSPLHQEHFLNQAQPHLPQIMELPHEPQSRPTVSQHKVSRYTPAIVQTISDRFPETPDGDYGEVDADESSLHDVTIVDEAQPQSAKKPTKKPYQRKVGVRLGAAGMVVHTRNQRLLKLIGQAGGAYPADRELYYAFATDFSKDQADVLPDWPTIKRSVKQLVDAKKLTKITFVFADKNGVTTKKHILLLPGTKGDSEHVRRLQRRMIAAHPQYHFPEGVEISHVYAQRQFERRGVDAPSMQTRTVVSREELLPAWAPKRFQAPVTQEPAWRQWAKAEKVGGDLAQAIREAAAGTDSDEEAYDEEPDEEQLGMQAQFQLGTYAHNSTAVPQTALSKGAKYASRTAWFRKQKERGNQSGVEREHREKIWQERMEGERLQHLERQRQEAAKKQREFVAHLKMQKQQQERAKAANSAIRKPDIDLSNISLQFAKDIGLLDMDVEELEHSQHQYYLETEVDNNSSGFVSTTISSTPAPVNRFGIAPKAKSRQPAAPMIFQASPIFFVQKTPVSINPSAWIWPHRKRRPGRQPISAPLQSLTDPDQKWHRTTGTFSTDFFFHRASKPALKINVNSHRDWENRIPGSLEEIIEQRKKLGTAKARRAPIDFSDQVDQVALWEKDNDDLINDMSLVNPRFINFTVPEEVATQTMWQVTTPEPAGGQYFGELGDKSARKYTYQPSSIKTPQSGFKKPALPETAGRKGKKSNATASQQHTTMNSEEHRRLIAGVVILRTLLGGIEQQISWSMVEKLLPDHNGSTLQNHWKAFSRTHVLQLARFQDEFERVFAGAYEQRLVPPIDFDHLASYDWDGVLVWTMQNLQVPTEEPDTQLPNERQVLENLFETQNEPLPEDNIWEDYFKELTTHVKRTEIINTVTYDDALDCLTPINSSDAQTCARSLLRANAFAPEDGYNPVAARKKIESSFTEPEVDTALATLMSSGVLIAKNKGRPVPGRNYYVSDRYNQHIKRNALDIPNLQAACSAKVHIDNTIFDPAGPGFYSVDYTASNGEIMLILELVAQGRLELQLDVPPTTFDPDVKCLDPVTGARHLSIWGFTVGEGHYKSTKMDRENLTFRVNAYPTASYVSGVPLQNPLPPPPAPTVMTVDGKVRVPLWYDVHDNLLPEIWEAFVAMVLGAVVLRPGCGTKYIMEKMTRKIVEEWDVQIAIEWLANLGVVSGSWEEGWCAKEWWWAVFGCGAGMR